MKMKRVEEPWEPFEIVVMIEGESETLLVVPDREEPKYEIFDQFTSIGRVWSDQGRLGKFWCGEGLIVKELLDQIGESIDNYLNNKPV